MAALLGLVVGACAGLEPRLPYWGDVHGHTMHSDGKGTVAEYLTHARDVAGLDFVVVSDHDFGNGPPWRMPVEVWRHTVATTDEFTVDGEFIAIAGYEWTSQPKYWRGFEGLSEGHFDGPPRHFNHKNVYFVDPPPTIFSAKDLATHTPDRLAAAVATAGGLIHNNHPDAGPGGADQWDYDPAFASVIANTAIDADVIRYQGETYEVGTESTIRRLLATGRRTGFVKGTDTHEGQPAARTAVYARALTREALFEALRARRCYAVTNARIVLDFQIDGHGMGEDIAIRGDPRITVAVQGTDRIASVEVIRDGEVVHSLRPGETQVLWTLVDHDFPGRSYYYVRVTQEDCDEHGNPSRAWSSPIWVRRR